MNLNKPLYMMILPLFSSLRLFTLLLLLLLLLPNIAFAIPSFNKVFNPSTISTGGISTLTFTLSNSDASPVSDLAFTDTFPMGLTIATPANAITDCNEGILSAPDGGNTVSLSNARLAPNGVSCTISVNVSATTTATNITGVLNSNAGVGGTASATLTVDSTLPTFSKSFSPSTIPLGGTSTLTFDITNSAATGISSLNFSDNLPSGMIIATPANASTTCGNPALPATFTASSGTSLIFLSANGFLPTHPVLGANSSCTTSVDVTTTTNGTFVNTSGQLTSGNQSSGFAIATLNVPVQFLVKSFIDDPVAPGDSVTLQFTVNNLDRNFTATNISFTDDLDATLTGLVATGLPLSNVCGTASTLSGTGNLSLSGGTLPAGGSCSFDVTLQVPASASTGSYPNTTGAITADVNGGSITGNTASDNLIVNTAPVLTKSFTDDPVGAGGVATLEFTITNPSTTSSATDISFLDELTTFLPFPVAVILPADGFCGAGSNISLAFIDTDRQGLSSTNGELAAGASCTFSVQLNIPNDLSAGTYTNTTSDITATVDGTTQSGLPASDDLIIVAPPTLTKSFTNDPVQPGGTVTLEFSLTHDALASGNATAITFTDDLNATLAGLTASAGQLPLSDVCGASNGLLTGSAGDTLLSFTGASLTPGEVCTFSLSLDVPAAAPAGDHTNTSSGIMATVHGVTATGNPASDDLRISGLLITKEFLNDPVIPGEDVTLRFNIENMHPSDNATAIVFTDNLSTVLPGTPNLIVNTPLPTAPCGAGSSIIDAGFGFLILIGGELLAGDSCSFDISLSVPAGVDDGTYTNTTSILTATLGSASLVSDPATDSLTINSNLLALSKEFTNDPVSPGSTVNLHFILSNLDSTQAASDLAFSDDLDAVLSGLVATGLPVSACGGTVSGTSVISLAGGNLPAGASCEFDVAVSVPAMATPNTYTNTTGAVTGTIGGFSVSGDAANDDLEVIDLLVFNKSFDGPSTATGTPTLTFTITNPGTGSVSNVAFSDNLDDVITGLIASNLPLNDVCGIGSQISGTTFLTLTGANLPPMGGMCSFDINLTVPSTATEGTFPNITSDLLQSGLKVAEPATADLTIEPPPSFAKVFAPDTIAVNGISTLTFTIDNSASTLAASSLDFTDTLPAGLVIATPPSASTTCTGGTLTAASSTSTIGYTGGTAGAGIICTIQVDTTGGMAASYVNTSGDLTSSSGNSGTASDTLVIDPVPVVTPPIDINMEATATLTPVTLGSASVADNDSGLTATPSSTGPFPVGETIVTWTSTADAAGNVGTATQKVTITDNTNPVVTPPIDITMEATGPTTAVTLGSASVVDLVTSGLTATPSTTGPFPVGETIVTWTSAADAAGNVGTATQKVTITDNTNPVVTPPIDITMEATGSTTAVTLGSVSVVDLVTSGLTATPSTTGPFPVGETIVTWTSAADAAGNVGTATQKVTITDNTNPVVTPPIDITMEATGPTTAVTLGSASVVDLVTSGLVATPSTTGPFPVGETIVTWTSSADAAGNVGTATQKVTITDNTNPVVTPPIDITTEATGPTTAVTLGTASVVDLVTSGLTATPSTTGPFPVGETIVTWTSTADAAGNVGTATQKVTITDNTSPVVTPPIDITMEATGPTTAVTLGSASVVDLVTSGLVATASTTGPFPVGETIVTWTSTADAAGNVGTATQKITITPVTSFTGLLPSGNTGTISFTSNDPACSFFTDPTFVDETTVTPVAPPNIQLIDGLVSFVIENCAAGATVDITMNYNQQLDFNAVYWKIGLPGFVIPSTVNGTSINFSITDGGVGDDDNVAGQITDPSGAATMNPIAVPSNNIYGILLLISLLLLGSIKMRGRKSFLDLR